jgi:hypothetical protein
MFVISHQLISLSNILFDVNIKLISVTFPISHQLISLLNIVAGHAGIVLNDG